jgi:hypothetical protein
MDFRSIVSKRKENLMTQLMVRGLVLVFGMFVAGAPAVAHHAFATEFDFKQPVKMRGYVTKVQWTNPHGWFYINVKDEATGKTENWGFEMGAPAALYRLGWSQTSMKIGEEVIVEGSRARDGSKRANARDVTIVRTGQKFGAASSENQNNNP